MVGTGTFLQGRVNGHTLVKHKAFAFPERLISRRFFKIFQDPAFKLINLFEADLLHVRRKLFASNAASAEHRDAFVFSWIEVFRNKGRKIAKLCNIWVYGSAKCAGF